MLRGCCAKKKQTKWRRKLPSLDEEIQFLSSVTIPNLRKALEENFLDSDSGYEDCTSDSDDGSENIFFLFNFFFYTLFTCITSNILTYRHNLHNIYILTYMTSYLHNTYHTYYTSLKEH